MRRPAALLAALLVSGALAHSEPVEVAARLTPLPNAVQVEADFVGQTSGLPVRNAVAEVRVSRDAGAEVLARARLLPGEGGRYTGRLAPLRPGQYVLTVVDTTYQGEAAVAARAFILSGGSTRVAVVLPITSTPGRYVVYALLGLLAPLLVLGLVLGTRRLAPRRAA